MGVTASECNRLVGGTRGSETSQYPQEEKIKNDSVSSGERKRKRLNLWCVIAVRRCIMGVVGVTVSVLTGWRMMFRMVGERLGMVGREGGSPGNRNCSVRGVATRVARGSWNLV